MARFLISLDEKVQEIMPGGPREVPVGSTPGVEAVAESGAVDPDIVIQLNIGGPLASIRCWHCNTDFSQRDLEQQVVDHFDQRFEGYRVDEALAKAMNEALQPWRDRFVEGQLICFDCYVKPPAGPESVPAADEDRWAESCSVCPGRCEIED